MNAYEVLLVFVFASAGSSELAEPDETTLTPFVRESEAVYHLHHIGYRDYCALRGSRGHEYQVLDWPSEETIEGGLC